MTTYEGDYPAQPAAAASRSKLPEIYQGRGSAAAAGSRVVRDRGGKLAELTEQRIGARYKLNRMDIRALQGGFSGLIAPGESVLQIVPSTDTLVVEMRPS